MPDYNVVVKLKTNNSDLGAIIETKNNEIKKLKEENELLKKALWCPNCAINIKKLKEIKREWLQ